MIVFFEALLNVFKCMTNEIFSLSTEIVHLIAYNPSTFDTIGFSAVTLHTQISIFTVRILA